MDDIKKIYLVILMPLLILISLFGCKAKYGTHNLNDDLYSRPIFKQNRFHNKSSKQINSDCNIYNLGKLDSLLIIDPNKITPQEISSTFKGLRDWCRDMIEYSQYQNEILYKLLDQKTQVFVETLNKSELDQFQIDYLKAIFESPINDSFDLNKIKTQLENLEDSKMQKVLLEAVNVAMSKY